MPAAYLKAPAIYVEQRCKKTAWPSRQKAMAAMKDMRKPLGLVQAGVGTMNCYRCPTCKEIHIGHRP